MHHFQSYLPLSVQSICNFYATKKIQTQQNNKKEKGMNGNGCECVESEKENIGKIEHTFSTPTIWSASSKTHERLKCLHLNGKQLEIIVIFVHFK